ncbi:hypothetical protein BT96DRAFT_940126 [Gymnopus androsaceus JB14]|uniref:Ketopantoate reductase-like protein n=1 Tax=Gymnopus androsaceus JB14 TaxID=1447944 RepID=A0A6A4HL83_9AGAR|nr:hypothetical protein BT96DRAFT_940126 [Gymnopus androsaceus JB14]
MFWDSALLERLIAHHLRRSLPDGHSISLIHRTILKARNAFHKNGISVEERGSHYAAQNFNHGTAKVDIVSTSPTTTTTDPSSSETRFIESLFVTLKAHQTLPVLRSISHRLSPNSTIVLLQNGMGVYEELVREIFVNPKQRPHFILASNTHGVHSRGLLDVVHAGKGEIKFGIVPDIEGRNFEAGFQDSEKPMSDRRASLTDITQSEDADPMFARYRSLRNTVAALLLMGALNTSWVPMEEMQLVIRRKLAINAAINPLTALMGCKNGDLFQSDPSRSLLRKICSEASMVFKAEMLAGATQFMSTSGASRNVDVLLDRIPESLTRQSLERECLRVAEATKDNYSSMLRDMQRPDASGTEIDYINGHLLALAKTVNDFVDSDISGLGVRVIAGSIYKSSLSFSSVILVDRSWEEAPTALWTFIATNFGLTIAAIIQFKKQQLSLLEALQVSNLVWLANFGIFVALASYSRHKRNSRQKKKKSGSKKKEKEKEESDYSVKTAAMVQTILSMGLTLYMWATAKTFGQQSVECISSLRYVLFVWKIPIVHSGMIVGLTFSTILTCAYIGVTLHEYWTSYQKRKAKKSKRDSTSKSPPPSPSPAVQPPPSPLVLEAGKSHRARPERKEWSDIDPMLIGILIFETLVFLYLIVSNERLLSDNNADTGQFGFGQVLSGSTGFGRVKAN